MRPGEASVQYDDVRGEVAGDIADDLSNSLQNLATRLGFNEGGRVVGLTISQVEPLRKEDAGRVSVYFQVVKHEVDTEKLKESIRRDGGTLMVMQYVLHDVDIVDVLRGFKRFEIGLFTRHLEPSELDVEDTISLNKERSD